uniref:Dimer_Tnp_hAT domain-containing protein n=1 Tax=Rhabditophanes sp. KR3021 TaxID=114890 RepID=A0AC35U1W9_9BILA
MDGGETRKRMGSSLSDVVELPPEKERKKEVSPDPQHVFLPNIDINSILETFGRLTEPRRFPENEEESLNVSDSTSRKRYNGKYDKHAAKIEGVGRDKTFTCLYCPVNCKPINFNGTSSVNRHLQTYHPNECPELMVAKDAAPTSERLHVYHPKIPQFHHRSGNQHTNAKQVSKEWLQPQVLPNNHEREHVSKNDESTSSEDRLPNHLELEKDTVAMFVECDLNYKDADNEYLGVCVKDKLKVSSPALKDYIIRYAQKLQHMLVEVVGGLNWSATIDYNESMDCYSLVAHVLTENGARVYPVAVFRIQVGESECLKKKVNKVLNKIKLGRPTVFQIGEKVDVAEFCQGMDTPFVGCSIAKLSLITKKVFKCSMIRTLVKKLKKVESILALSSLKRKVIYEASFKNDTFKWPKLVFSKETKFFGFDLFLISLFPYLDVLNLINSGIYFNESERVMICVLVSVLKCFKKTLSYLSYESAAMILICNDRLIESIAKVELRITYPMRVNEDLFEDRDVDEDDYWSDESMVSNSEDEKRSGIFNNNTTFEHKDYDLIRTDFIEHLKLYSNELKRNEFIRKAMFLDKRTILACNFVLDDWKLIDSSLKVEHHALYELYTNPAESVISLNSNEVVPVKKYHPSSNSYNSQSEWNEFVTFLKDRQSLDYTMLSKYTHGFRLCQKYYAPATSVNAQEAFSPIKATYPPNLSFNVLSSQMLLKKNFQFFIHNVSLKQ